MHLWDEKIGEQHTLTAGMNSVESIAFSPDGQILSSGSADGKVLLWNLTQSTLSQSTPVTANEDVNSDGVVDIIDLVLVANAFGTTGNDDKDVNGDGVVDIIDLVLVANAFGDGAAAPAMQHLVSEYLTQQHVSQWLHAAKALRQTEPDFLRGIHVLENILTMFTPQTTILLSNYPNPFNPETWIPYQLAEATVVTVTIHSLNGTLIRTLSLGNKTAGLYRSKNRAAYWDGKNEFGERVASGLYFYTLTAGQYSATGKMLIRK